MTTVYLGAPEPAWIGRTTIPLMVSYGRLARLVAKLPRSPYGGGWAVDSRGFMELRTHGRWTITPERYVADVARYDVEIGNLEWAGSQDSMVEDEILAMTGRGVLDHQLDSTRNYLRLSRLWERLSDRDSPFMLTLQGKSVEEYLLHWDIYEDFGVDVSNVEVVGLGSVCRRGRSQDIVDIVSALKARDPGLPIHGYGVKVGGLERCGSMFGSTDSSAWSEHARRNNIKNPRCVARHQVCNYCLLHASECWQRLNGLYGDRSAAADLAVA